MKLEPDPTWSEAEPRSVPAPSRAPITMASGILLAAWGIVTSPIVFGAGVLLLTAALVGWIGELRHEP